MSVLLSEAEVPLRDNWEEGCVLLSHFAAQVSKG